MNPTRYTLTVTFGGDESEAPEDWHKAALLDVSSFVNRDFTSGEIAIHEGDKTYRGWWNLEAEDE